MKKVVYLLFSVFLVVSCGKEKKTGQSFDYGHIENDSVYVNNFFSLKVPINSNWHVQNKKQMAEILDLGKESLTNNKKLKKDIDAASINVAQLLMVFKYELNSISLFNPSFGINVENLKKSPEIKTRKDYSNESKKSILMTDLNIVYRKQDYDVKIGGENFTCSEVENLDYKIFQDCLVTLKNGFAITIIVSYDNEEDKKELYKIISNIEFINN